MKMLDRSRPFGTIRGVHRARYAQDGMDFDINGRMLGKDPAIRQPPEVVQEEVPLDNLTIAELKELVEQAGGHYKNRIDAISFLKNKTNDIS